MQNALEAQNTNRWQNLSLSCDDDPLRSLEEISYPRLNILIVIILDNFPTNPCSILRHCLFRWFVFPYLLCASALSRLCEQFDGCGALGHSPFIVAVLLGVVLRRAGDGLFTRGWRCAGCRLPLEQRLVLTALVTANIHTRAHRLTCAQTHGICSKI